MKKRICFCLIVIAFVLLFASTAMAAYGSYDGSIATYQDFRNGTNNTIGYDADGCYGCQCWDGVQIFYRRLGMSLSTGNVYNAYGEREGYAKHCWDDVNARSANTGTQFTQITRIEDVKRGDVVVFSGPAYTGHIAFADEDNNPGKTKIAVWGQNQRGDGSGNPFTLDEWNKSYFLGAFRYKGWEKEPDVSFDVNFTVNGENKEYIYGIGEISVVVGGEVMTYQDKQHSSATTSYSDFCRAVPGGKEYEVRVNITDSNYYCSGVNQGQMIGMTSSNIVVNLNITSTKPERVIPDGDYLIISSASENKSAFFYLDIEGTAQPATNETNVSLCGPLTGDKLTNVPEYEIWTLTYGNDGFYTIKQKGTDMALDVYGGSNAARANVSVHQGNDSKAQKWVITKNGNNGYRLQARCSAMFLDIKGGNINASGTNVQQYPTDGGNAKTSQSWLFIPYNPSQPIENGRYVLLYGGADGYELDVPGNSGDIGNNTPVQIWDSSALSQFNSFEFIKLSNGYYKVKHIASGKCLDVTDGLRDYKSKVKLYEDNNSIAQQWAVIPNESGYSIIARCNGYALDLPDGTTTNGTVMEVYPRLGNDHQRWTFVEAEHTITFDANQGANPPSAQIKYYNNPLTLTTAEPSREGYVLLGWSTDRYAEAAEYLVGGEFLADKDTILYAIWESMTYTLSYDANEGSGAPAAVTVEGGGAVTLSMDKPVREGYDFLGWSLNPGAVEPEYQPGDVYPGRKGTLYAVWKIKEFIVSFLSEGAGPFDPMKVTYGSNIGELPVPERKGYFFKGWFDQNDNKVTAETIVKSALVLTASWAEPTTLVLPAFLTDIEDEAFEDIDANIIVIPETVKTIGSKAFANNDSLYLVYVYSTTVSPAADAFLNCPNLTICGYAEKPIEYYAIAKKIPFVPFGFVSDWVQESELPIGATVIDQKWTYNKTVVETTTSTETSMEGWEQTGFEWELSGNTGIVKFASYPDGYNKNDAPYKLYNRSQSTDTETETKKRVYSEPTFYIYGYWHWCWVDNEENDRNKTISDVKGKDPGDGLDYIYFDRIYTSIDLTGRPGMTTNGLKTIDGLWSTYGTNYDKAEYGSHWWFRVTVYQQNWTEYNKLFTYTRKNVEEKESNEMVSEGEDISNVQRWIKYGF